METFEDILAANLTSIVPPNKPIPQKNYETDTFEKLLKIAIVSKTSFEESTRTLMDHRNITCFDREQTALLIIRKYRKQVSQCRMKILKEIMRVRTSGMYLERSSPYKNRFQNIMNALVKSGISVYPKRRVLSKPS